MKIGSALAKFESTSSLTPVANSWSAAVRATPRDAGASQSCDSSPGSRGWLVGCSATSRAAGACCARGAAAGASTTAISVSPRSLSIFTSTF